MSYLTTALEKIGKHSVKQKLIEVNEGILVGENPTTEELMHTMQMASLMNVLCTEILFDELGETEFKQKLREAQAFNSRMACIIQEQFIGD